MLLCRVGSMLLSCRLLECWGSIVLFWGSSKISPEVFVQMARGCTCSFGHNPESDEQCCRGYLVLSILCKFDGDTATA